MQMDKLKELLPNTHWVLVDDLSNVIDALTGYAKTGCSFKQHPNTIKFYNSYIDFALSVYIDKFRQLYAALAQSLLDENYLVYSMCGRSIIENAATFRYYARNKGFSELFSSKCDDGYSEATLKNLINLLDKLVRGNRFSWDAFMEGRFTELTNQAGQEHPSQTNVMTCIEHWCKESKNLQSLYNLLCDLVHPNLGNNFLVMKSYSGELVAGGDKGENVSMFIICPTLAGIVGTYKEIQESFLMFERNKLPANSFVYPAIGTVTTFTNK
ncbi:hypothetical protein [Geomonas edaphica]|uniref:hypothetical protein n=1 Tax=Geomonas edaphica TaxID=2570226 RepID=UPI0010A91443|nr:hypothetical protein [Geomonas edaphica]